MGPIKYTSEVDWILLVLGLVLHLCCMRVVKDHCMWAGNYWHIAEMGTSIPSLILMLFQIYRTLVEVFIQTGIADTAIDAVIILDGLKTR